MLNAEALAEITGRVIRDHVRDVIGSMVSRLDIIETRVNALTSQKDDMLGLVERIMQSDVKAQMIEIRREIEANIPNVAEDVAPLVASEVEKAVSALPKPQDGEDGRGVASMLIDRSGELVTTLTDGTVIRHGVVVGKDGQDADMAALEKQIADAVALLPKPQDGNDGLGFDDLDVTETDEGIFLRFARGDQVKTFRLDIPRDCGVFQTGRVYRKGDGVSYAGSFFIAQEETTDKPETGKSWRLAVKRGRDRTDPVKVK